MRTHPYLHRGVAVSVIALLIALAFAPSINANVSEEDEFVEVTTEFCGLGKKHTIQLTQQEIDEIDALFESIRERLDRVESREETVHVFNDAIAELEKYGLLGGLNVEQSQKLVTGMYQHPRMKLLEKIYDRYGRTLDDNQNFLCLVSGQTDGTTFLMRHIGVSLILSFIPIFAILGKILGMDGLFILPIYYCFIKPLAFGNRISLGILREGSFGWSKTPASGWLYTIGLNGIKNWNGSFYGQIPIPFGLILALFLFFYTGIVGFTGIKIQSSEAAYFYMGTALLANIGPDAPEFPWLPE